MATPISLRPPARPRGTNRQRRPIRRTTSGTILRCLTLNTHRGRGPRLDCIRLGASPTELERIALLHETRAYAYCIADWLQRRQALYDVVALQEVFNGLLGFGERLFRRAPQHDYYRVFSGYPSAIGHGVGFAGFRYENLLLSRLRSSQENEIHSRLPGRVLLLAACGFTLAPFEFGGRVVWIGNTHLHAYNPRARANQAASLAAEVRRLGDVPVLFLGDLNTVPPGSRTSGFPAGDRDDRSYVGDDTIRILEDAGLRRAPHADTHPFHTYPTGAPNRTLDYILHSDHWEVLSYRVVSDFAFSDHYPVAGAFRLR